MKLQLGRIAEFLKANGEFDPNAVATGYSIDSRTIRAGELFFAVKGDRMDGHDFVQQALGKGAVAAGFDAAQAHGGFVETPPGSGRHTRHARPSGVTAALRR